MSDHKNDRKPAGSLTRRRFLDISGKAAATTGLASAFPAILPSSAMAQENKELRILQWSHFVPQYDKWFDGWAKAWGEAHDAKVTVDHISIADLPAAIASEVSAGTGHDLIELGPASAQFEPSLVDLADINQEARSRFGDVLATSKRYSYNPVTDKWFAFCHGWTIDPGDYRKSLWDAAGQAGGPAKWEDLITIGSKIFQDQGVPVGIGLSQEYDSNMAHRSLLYSFGASVQDEGAKVILDQGENMERALEAAEFVVKLFNSAMTPEVFAWNAASNNQTLIAGRSSFILNSISAYRAAQRTKPDIAKDIYFTPALQGPHGDAHHCAHVIYNYVMPQYSKNIDLGKKFILDVMANYDQAMWNSQLYNTPSYLQAPIMAEGERGYPAVSGAKKLADLHKAWFTNDPFKLESEEDGKLKPLLDGTDWTVNVGFPGTSNPAVGEVWNRFIIPNMMARAVRGEQTPADSIKRAADEARKIFAAWRERGLI